MLGLAVDAEPKARTAFLSEARGWLREHRTTLATLSALAGDIELPPPGDQTPWLLKETAK
jgi:hypothetical protein